jgi:agmatine deiminase
MNVNREINKSFWPAPFWAMDQRIWFKYVNSLEDKERRTLDAYPFKWAYAPPYDGQTAVQFLQEIGVAADLVNADAVQAVFDGMPTFDELLAYGVVRWGTPDADDHPADGFRMIPEWEPMLGVLLNWPTFYPPLWDTYLQMVTALDHVKVFLRVPEGFLGAAGLAWLGARGVDLNKVQPLPGPLGDIWARDYSPIYGINTYTGEAVAHKFSFAAYSPAYQETFGPSVKVDDRFVWTEGFTTYRSALLLDGGNLLTNGDGTYVLTRRVLRDNAGVPNLYAKLEQWLGAERLIIIDEEPGDRIGHINHLKFLSSNKILIGIPDEKDSPRLRYLRNLHSQFEIYGYEVIGVPFPESLGRPRVSGEEVGPALYANSLLVNGRVLVSTFGIEEYDSAALEIYRNALPDYEVIGIDASILINDGGAINCASKEIPDVSIAQATL